MHHELRAHKSLNWFKLQGSERPKWPIFLHLTAVKIICRIVTISTMIDVTDALILHPLLITLNRLWKQRSARQKPEKKWSLWLHRLNKTSVPGSRKFSDRQIKTNAGRAAGHLKAARSNLCPGGLRLGSGISSMEISRKPNWLDWQTWNTVAHFSCNKKRNGGSNGDDDAYPHNYSIATTRIAVLFLPFYTWRCLSSTQSCHGRDTVCIPQA